MDRKEASPEDVVEIANNLSSDQYFEQEVRQAVAEVLVEAAYSTDNNPGSADEVVEMDQIQESELVEVAMRGVMTNLAEATADDFSAQ